MDLLVTTAAQRPDLVSLLDDFNDWPAFMYVLIGIDRDHPERLVARGYSVPFGVSVRAMTIAGGLADCRSTRPDPWRCPAPWSRSTATPRTTTPSTASRASGCTIR